MHALVGQEAPFDHGREQRKVLAGLEVTTKSVERTAEAIGAAIAQHEPNEIRNLRGSPPCFHAYATIEIIPRT